MSDAEHVPSWVPEIAPGVRADVYPVSPPTQTGEPHSLSPPELVLDRHAVTAGYAERRLPYEFSSCLPATVTAGPPPPLSSVVPGAVTPAFNPAAGTGLSAADLSKLRTGIAQLRRSRPTKLQRVEEKVFPVVPLADGAWRELANAFGGKKSFPLQKPAGSNALEDWFNKLSSGANFSTSELSRSVPLGPAIVRAAGKVIEMMATRAVPAQRAAWYIRIAVMNECVKQIRPDREQPSPESFWTKQLCNLLKTEIEAIRVRKTAMLGSMDRVAFWDYVLDLARWQQDEGLLDCPQWMTRICSLLQTELLSAQSFNSPGTKITIAAARRFLPEFLSCPATARQVLEALLPGASAIVKAWRGHSPAGISAKGDTSGPSPQNKRDPKGSSRRTSLKRPPFTPNLCHREVTMILSALVRFLDESVPSSTESVTKMSDLERFVKRGVSIVLKHRNQENGDSSTERSNGGQGTIAGKDAPQENSPSTHQVMLALEMLPGHGDVGRVAALLLKSFENRGGLGVAVKQVCQWAVDGPCTDRDESICIAIAVIEYLAKTQMHFINGANGKQPRVFNQDIHKPRSGVADSSWTPPMQRDMWHFMKEYSKERKPVSLSEDATIVRFIAQACRVELLSLRNLIRDISRLSSHSHPGSAFLVKCLSLLPGPVGQDLNQNDTVGIASTDCRRPLLRKYGYIASSRMKQVNQVSKRFTNGVLTGDMIAMKLEVEELRESGDECTILSTTEFVRLQPIWRREDSAVAVKKKLYTTSSFLLRLGGPGPAVEWLLGNLGELVNGSGIWSSSGGQRRNEVMLELTRLVEDFSRYLAASGLLEPVFNLLKKAWLGSWISAGVRRRILLTTALLARLFAGDAGNSSYWLKLVARNLRQKAEGPAAAKRIPLALASVRGQADGSTSLEMSLEDLFIAPRKEFSSPEEEMALLMSKMEIHNTSVSELRSSFATAMNPYSFDDLFDKGFTANDIFGAILVPALVQALEEPVDEPGDESLFSRLACSALQIVSDKQYDIRLQGVRPVILVEFIALIATGCLSGHTDTEASLGILVQTGWFWKVLAPKAGIGLAKRLRRRVDKYCDKIAAIEDSVVSALLFNMVARFSGDEDRNETYEASVSGAFGVEPFAMIDMKLALLATHRHESGEDEDFGSRISAAAEALICVDSARTLASGVLRSCCSEEARQVVAGLVGYGAVQAMAESLTFVVKGLTVEAPKNSLVHQERAIQWYQADRARRAILECIVDGLSQEVGVQVETVLFDQLTTATSLLTVARERNCMPSSLLEDGRRISDALQSRLYCVLKSQRTPQTAEIWTQRTIQIATLLHCAVPLMNKSAIIAATNTLLLCLKNLGTCETKSGDGATGTKSASQVLDACDDDGSLRTQLQELLKPVLLWVDEAEKKMIGNIIEGGEGVGRNRNEIVAYNNEGLKLENWVLLEGYGRGADEVAAIPPSAFGRQGGADVKVDVEPVVQLKRTYSTFSSLAV